MRRLAIFTGAFSLGIFLAQYLLPDRWLLPCGVLAFLAAWGRLFLPELRGRRLLLAGTGLALALGWNWLYVLAVQAPMEALAETETAAVMTAQDYPETVKSGVRVTVRVEGLPGKAVLYGGAGLADLEPGQTVRGCVRFRSAARIREDDLRNFTAQGVFLLAYGRGELTVEAGSAGSPRWWPVRMGRAMRETAADLFDGETAAFLAAILTGDKSGLSEEVLSDLSEAGLYHMLAVSGMHCGFLLALLRLAVGKHRRRLLAGVSALALVFYALLTGGRPSVVRACVMLLLLLAAPLFGRQSDGPTSLLAAMFLILLANPFAAGSVGLQLSFGAMAGILWVTPRLYRMLVGEKQRSRGCRYLAAGVSATVGALMWTAPLSGLYFGVLGLVSPLSNLLCLWAASAVFLTGLAAVLAGMLFPPLGAALGWIPTLLVRYLLTCAHVLAKLPYHAVYFANPYLKYWLAFAYLLFLPACLLRPKRRRTYALAAGLAVLALAVTVRLGVRRYQSDLDVLVLDVGQGQCVLLHSGGVSALVDCGSANSWYGAGGIAADQLMSMGCRQLDYLVLTHYDSDHVNGVTGLLARLKVGVLLVPEGGDGAGMQAAVLAAAEVHGTPVRFVRDREELNLGRASLRVFPPVGESGDNQRGLAVLATAGEEDLLITGDMDAATEKRLLEAYALPDIEYLAAGHHGSRHSTCDALLDAVTPETVCISVGSNSYGHPAAETLERLARHGCAVYRTDLHGNIYLSLQRGDSHGTEEERDRAQ